MMTFVKSKHIENQENDIFYNWNFLHILIIDVLVKLTHYCATNLEISRKSGTNTMKQAAKLIVKPIDKSLRKSMVCE